MKPTQYILKCSSTGDYWQKFKTKPISQPEGRWVKNIKLATKMSRGEASIYRNEWNDNNIRIIAI
jgi:hypothetical protein